MRVKKSLKNFLHPFPIHGIKYNKGQMVRVIKGLNNMTKIRQFDESGVENPLMRGDFCMEVEESRYTCDVVPQGDRYYVAPNQLRVEGRYYSHYIPTGGRIELGYVETHPSGAVGR